MTATPVRALFVLPSFAGGGAERVALNIVGRLRAGDVTPHLLVLEGSGPLAALVPADVPCTVLGVPRLRHALRRIIGEIRRLRPDVVFSTLGYINLALLALRPLLPRGTRIVVREANLPSLSLAATSRPGLLRAAYRWFYRQADTVVATSERMADELCRDFRVPAVRIVIVPNPVDEDAIRSAAAAVQRRAGDGLRLVAAGRLTRQKGFDRLIELLPSLDRAVSVAILGDGEDGAALGQQAERLGVADRLVFLGFMDNPWAWYAGADAFVMPSRWEGMPNAALEALACGTPVIATPEAGGIAEVADRAPAGAVTVAAMGEPFLAALRGLEPRAKPGGPRTSLLPPEYRADTVSAALSDILRSA
ncbi:MAG: glycosyltransferase [Rhodospirillales bacterium]